MDFVKIRVLPPTKKDGPYTIRPTFIAKASKDLMIRGSDFYAVWDESKGKWSTDQDDVVDLIDDAIDAFRKEHPEYKGAKVEYMWDADSGSIDRWHKYVQKQMADTYHPLDESLTFRNTQPKREDYSSKVLPYSLEPGLYRSWDELVGTLYSPPERHKIEWAIGSVVTGDSRNIQKFFVFYGEGGTGKSTILKVIKQLFDGYYTVFNAKALGSGSDSFALEPFKSNPLVAIDDEGDLSRIEDNTRLNALVSHDELTVNEKFKTQYTQQFKAMLFMGTNKPVKITDSRSGVIRRLVDISPTGKIIPIDRYLLLMDRIRFELGAIAWHCMEVYQEDPHAYDAYIPKSMIGATNDFYNFMEEKFDEYLKKDCVTWDEAWSDYKFYCDEAKIPYPYKKTTFKEEMKNYFRHFEDRSRLPDGRQVRSLFSGFKVEKFGYAPKEKEEPKEEVDISWLELKEQPSIFDKEMERCVAQYANEQETPIAKWSYVKTKLKDIDTSKLHYVRVPVNHIVIDFDLRDGKEKSLEKNIEAASKWPPTYAELSKGGKGLHLHYIYSGDPTMLSRIYDDQIEVKVFTGMSSLRRRLSKCNDIPIATINSGLPLKGEVKTVNFDSVKNEKALRTMIRRSLNKEYEPCATKPSCDFINKILKDAYDSGMKYDVTDLRPAVLAFAAQSTHNAPYCIKLVNQMLFKSEEVSDPATFEKDELIFYDVEVFPNLFVVVYKAAGGQPVKMINPSGEQIEELCKYKLVGFNCRRYDNHILYARILGYSNERLYDLSQRIINGSKNCFFGEAYNISYTDVYDFCSKKQSLKKWEIELDIHHQELGLPWDQPVDESLWEKVAEYCINDVVATEAVFNARHQDFVAREILADISGLTVNDTTNQHSTRIIFGQNKHPQDQFVYTDLSTIFPGYTFDNGKSWYRGEDPKEGGYVYAEPGMYENVALLDVASMHPTSIEQLNLFGPYTKIFSDLKRCRVLIKHGEFDQAGEMFDGKLKPYLTNPEQAKSLSDALKIVINSVYGLTSANFDNPFRDPRNKDNIVAKRGALFMIDLKHAVQEKGFTVAHIKTDSIKIPNATSDIIEFVMEFGKKYGYIFEHEATYEKMCLVNDAVYIAKYKDPHPGGQWTATGTQFQVPYVFKTLFSKDPIEFKDMCEAKTVTSALYLDMNEGMPEGEHNYIFIGKAGSFCPIKPGCGGGNLLRQTNTGGYAFATGSKGYRWMESEMVRNLHKEEEIDRGYYASLVDEAKASIEEYGDFEWFAN